jgi:hypothetical protein
MHASVIIAQDETGKTAVLWHGETKDVDEGDKVFESDKALKEAGLTGEIRVAVFRELSFPWKTRHASIVEEKQKSNSKK